MALGGDGGEVVQLVLKRGMALVAVGLVVGALGAIWATGFLDDLLFHIMARDPMTFAGVSLAFALAGFLACLIPAWRAVRIDPVDAFQVGVT